MNKQRAIHGYLSPALPRIFAHRGFAASPGVSENTVEAFRAAIELGATHIESDIQVTKDGIPVLFHDDDLARVAGLPQKISELLLTEVLAVELVDGGRIPTLRQVLVDFPATRFNLDLKVWSAVLPATQLIRELGAETRVLLTSFSDRRRASALKQVQVASSAGSSRVMGLWLAAKLRVRPVVRRLAKPVQALQIPTRKGPIRFDSPNFIAQMNAAGLELHYWTINDADEMRRLIALGAHGIVTDRTDLAVKTLRMVR